MVFFCFFQESLGPESLVLKKIRGGEHSGILRDGERA